MDLNATPPNAPEAGEPLTWAEIANELWELLDDIDTAEDIAKSDDAMFRRLARKAHMQRHRYAISDGYNLVFNVVTTP